MEGEKEGKIIHSTLFIHGFETHEYGGGSVFMAQPTLC